MFIEVQNYSFPKTLAPAQRGEGIVSALKTQRDVGSSHPGGGEAPKGRAVRPLKRYASWVQNVLLI